MSDSSGCKLMNCTDLKDGKCHYPGDTCKYRQDEDLERKLAAAQVRIGELEGENTKLLHRAEEAENAVDQMLKLDDKRMAELESLRQERDALREKSKDIVHGYSHTRVFLISREKMHPHGVEIMDKYIDDLRALID